MNLNLFSPITTLFNRLKYPQKFTLITLLFVLPLLAFYPLVAQQNRNIQDYGIKESYGVLYLRPLQQLLSDTQQYQLAANGSNANNISLDQAKSQIENDFQTLHQIDTQYGSTLQTSSELKDLEVEWQSLNNDTSTLTQTQRKAQQDKYIADIRALISHVGDTSFLILDPDLDTYYMMDAVLLKLPESQNLLVDTLALGESIIKKGSATLEERTQLIILTSLLKSNLSAMENNVQLAYNNNPSGEMQKLSKVSLQTYLTAANQFLDLINKGILNSGTINISLSDFAASANQALTTNKTFYDTASQSLEGGVQTRRQNEIRQIVSTLTIAVVGIVAAFVIGLLLMLSISRPLSTLADATQRLARGEMAVRVPFSGTDEVGQVGLSFNKMAEQLQNIQTSLEQRVAARTQDLATVAEVGTATSTILDTDKLLHEVVEITKDRFKLYHSHVYLLDDKGENLVLTAGAGEPGRIMVSEGRSIPLSREQSLVARAAREREGVTVNDVTQAPDFLPNPLLPDTRSELAVPMLVGETLVGVFDIQSDTVGRFTDADINIQTTLAAQLASSIQNARSYERSKTQAELESLVNSIGQKIQRAATVEDTLQIAIREVGLALGASRVSATIAGRETN